MGTRADERATSPRRRPLLVLVLLLCVLSMHSLGGGHAGMVMHQADGAGLSPHTSSSAMSSAMDTRHGVVVGTGSAAEVVRIVGSGGDAVVAAVGSHSGGPTATPLCLAVLLLAAGLFVRTGGWRHRVATPLATACSRRAVSPPGRAPPRDLLAQICVLRT